MTYLVNVNLLGEATRRYPPPAPEVLPRLALWHNPARMKTAALALILAVACSGCSRLGAEARAAESWDGAEERLTALPYVSTNPVPPADRGKVGLLHHDPRHLFLGFQLVTETDRIRLIDGTGRVRREITGEQVGAQAVFSEAELDPAGFMDLIDTDHALLRLDRHGNVVRRLSIPVHHDLTHHGDKTLVLTRRIEQVDDGDRPLPLLVDYVVVLSKEGTVEREISIHEVAGHLVPERSLQRAREWVEKNGDPVLGEVIRAQRDDRQDSYSDTRLDVYHTNFVQVADQEIPGVCRPGDLLLSIRNLNLILFLRPEDLSIVWSWGPEELEGQHNPLLLPNGNLLVFDNGRRRKWSRVLELDPRSRRIVWEYAANPRQSFFSPCCGSAEKLDSGNVVITDYTRGRIFEVTPDKQIVWDYRNSFADAAQQKRVSILRSQRVSPELGSVFIEERWAAR